ncbi:MAG: endonuclease/exonuclease/phosphatase family protein [Patescibacteria group bacterium]
MIKLISLNIETDIHHEKVVPFLKLENPDVVCLQEVFEKDLSLYEEALGMKSYFKPMSVHPSVKDKGATSHVVGIAILTKFPVTMHYHYYAGNENSIPHWVRSPDLYIAPHTANQLVLWVEMMIEGKLFRIATTHLPVTPPFGISTEYQLDQARKMLEILAPFESLIICGDLNAPRGKETFALFSDKYIDHVPLRFDSSIDPVYHKNPVLILMVDGLFSTPDYEVKDVELRQGLSDHKAIVAHIGKVN